MPKKNYERSKERIRQKIFDAVDVYRQNLLGRCFLYVFEDNTYVEVHYRKSSFAHLTGVGTKLNAVDFYNKAKSRKLTTSQFSFDKTKHPYDLAKKKTNRLEELSKFISSDLIMLKDVTTKSMIYRFGLTDTDLTLCFLENLDRITRKKIDNYFIPASFRVGDDTVSKSKDCVFVKSIFMKTNKNGKYQSMCYGESDQISSLTDEVKSKIDMDKIIHK